MITTTELPLYPIFKPGQTLSHDDLNNLRNYLSHQNRLTRTHLIGSGIFYGLEVSLEGNAIHISRGVGVTSKGCLIILEDTTYLKLKKEEIPLKKFLCKEAIDKLEDQKKEVNVLELLEGTNEDDEENELTRVEDLKDMTVVLLCDELEHPRERCMHTANENGMDGEVLVRKLLIRRKDAEYISDIENDNSDITGLENKDPFIERLGFGERKEIKKPSNASNGLWLEDLDSYQRFTDSYLTICKNAVCKLVTAYNNAAVFFSGILGDPVSFGNLENNLNALVNSASTAEGTLSLQYVYNYFRDLIDAYKELIHLDIFQSYSGYPDECRFPYHLNLGELATAEGADAQTLRTPFLKVPIRETGYTGLEEARFIKDKMLALVNTPELNFQIQPFNKKEIKITASKSLLYPLSDRAIPYYYSKELRNKWNFKLNKKKRSYTIPSYNPGSLAAPFHQPLLYDLGSWDFYRIEGYIGQELKDVLPTIENERKRLNIPFDIVVLKIKSLQEPAVLEGKFSDLQLMYMKVREDIICKLFNSAPLLNYLPVTLQLFSLSKDFYEEYHKTFNEDQIKDCNLKVLEKIRELYEDRLRRLQDIQYFHHFVQEHPGLEHMGGVPSGGTFVLLVRDVLRNEVEGTPENDFSEFIRTQVVADFCLPYSCCNNQPKVVYQITERVQPTANFNEVGERKYEYDDNCQLIGREITFENISENANYYVWLVNGHPQLNTLRRDQPFTFIFRYAESSSYQIKLIAHNDGLFSEAEQIVDICPTIKLQFDPETDRNEAGTYIFVQNGENDKASFKDLLPGGDFDLKNQEGKSFDNFIDLEGKIDPEKCGNIRYTFDYSLLGPGIYTLQYSIGECTLSEPITLEIRKQNDGDVILFSRGEEGGAEIMSEERSVMLNQRMAANKDKVQALAEDNSLAKTASFKRSQFFVNFSSTNIREVNKNFTEVIQLLGTNLKRTEDKQRQDQYITLAATVFHAYLDAQVAANVNEVPEATEEIINNAVETLKEAGVNITKIKNSWNSKGLQETLNAPAVAYYTKLLK